MDTMTMLRRLRDHTAWADQKLWEALSPDPSRHSDAWREYSHVLGAEETWLSRIEQRASKVKVWPELTREEAASLRVDLGGGYARLLGAFSAHDLESPISYTNSAQQSFTDRAGDILLHVMLHGQYHRGKINLMLRQGGEEPVPTDYIAFVRGVPAAVTPR